jgi:hypothetical protein
MTPHHDHSSDLFYTFLGLLSFIVGKSTGFLLNEATTIYSYFPTIQEEVRAVFLAAIMAITSFLVGKLTRYIALKIKKS